MSKHKRTYHFDLPYTIPGMYVHFGIDKLNNDGIFRKLPGQLQKDLSEAASSWSEYVITEEMLDLIDDDTMTALGKELDLTWSKQ